MAEKKTILVADDEQAFVEVLKLRLEALNFKVIDAYDGAEAIDKIKDSPPHLILLDIMMPKLNGYQVCKELKGNDKFKHIPIIIFTAKAQESDKAWGKECGADDFITKPYAFDDLIKRINKFLSR